MPYLNQLDCCGAAEAAEIREHNDPIRNLKDIYEQWCGFYTKPGTVDGPAVIFFSVQCPTDRAKGDGLYRLIQKENLGPVVAGPMIRNPNSGNKIKAYMWTVRPRKFHAWAKKTGEKWAKGCVRQAHENAETDNWW